METFEDGSVSLSTKGDVEYYFSDEYNQKRALERRKNMNFAQVLYDKWDYRSFKYRPYRRFEAWAWSKYHIPFKPKYFLQRAKRGWSDADVWNLHFYLDRILIEGLTSLRDESIGCPMIIYDENGEELRVHQHYPDISEEAAKHDFDKHQELWENTLNAIILALKKSQEAEDTWPEYDKLAQIQREKTKAMLLLAHNWEALWD